MQLAYDKKTRMIKAVKTKECKECLDYKDQRVDEYIFLQNLCELHQSDKITGFEFSELVKDFTGYSKAPNYLHDDLNNRGIDINDYDPIKIGH